MAISGSGRTYLPTNMGSNPSLTDMKKKFECNVDKPLTMNDMGL